MTGGTAVSYLNRDQRSAKYLLVDGSNDAVLDVGVLVNLLAQDVCALAQNVLLDLSVLAYLAFHESAYKSQLQRTCPHSEFCPMLATYPKS